MRAKIAECIAGRRMVMEIVDGEGGEGVVADGLAEDRKIGAEAFDQPRVVGVGVNRQSLAAGHLQRGINDLVQACCLQLGILLPARR